MIQIPNNLDIDSIVNQYPPEFTFTTDNFKYIINLILELPAWNNDLFQENEIPFVPINAILLQKAIWNYDDHIRYLENNGVIECDNHYLKGIKSKGYRLASYYRTKPKVDSIITPKLLNRLDRIVQLRNQKAHE